MAPSGPSSANELWPGSVSSLNQTRTVVNGMVATPPGPGQRPHRRGRRPGPVLRPAARRRRRPAGRRPVNAKASLFMGLCREGVAERVGFEPTCRLPDKTLSRRPRYDHFGTSPVGTAGIVKPSFSLVRPRAPLATAPGRIQKIGSRNQPIERMPDPDDPPRTTATPAPCNAVEHTPVAGDVACRHAPCTRSSRATAPQASPPVASTASRVAPARLPLAVDIASIEGAPKVE